MYEYEFDSDRCWYKGACSKYDTEKCRHNCIRFMEMDYLFYSSNIPKKSQYPVVLKPETSDLKSFRRLKEIKDSIVAWVDKGNNLFIGSNKCGNGKTSWAIKLMSKYFDSIWIGNCFQCRGKFINVTDFLIDMKSNISDNTFSAAALKDSLSEVDLIIWDDIGDAELTKYEYQVLYSIINNRILNGKANIYTCNVLGSQLEQKIGTRLTSRIYNNSEIIEFIGDDRRGM